MTHKSPIINRFRAPLKDGGWLALLASSLFCALCMSLARASALGISYLPQDVPGRPRFPGFFNWPLFFGTAAVTALVLLTLCGLFESPRVLGAALPGAAFCFAMLAAYSAPENILFALGLCLPLFFALRWAMAEGRSPFERVFGRPKLPMWTTHACALLLFLSFTAVMGYYSVLRYKTYNATNFDLGIFAQMFEFLRKTGHAFTTVERNQLLTHFGVHCSPIYYLLLPFYMIVPRIETILVLQAAAVGAGVFAVRGIAKELFGDSPRLIMLSCLLFVFNPSFSSGLMYDFHENKLLTVLVLFTAYFIIKQKALPTLLFAGLTLMVKEDAAIYVVSLGLFLLFARRWNSEWRRVFTGVTMLVCSVAWFAAAAAIVKHYDIINGTGVMVSRLENFYITEKGGFGEIFQVLLGNLGFGIKEVFGNEHAAKKLEFMLWTFLPLGFTPFLRKKGADWLLLVPLLVINFLSNYGYQYTIGYQYTFGSFALAIVLALLALRDCAPRLRRGLLLFAVAASMLCTVPMMGSRFTWYNEVISENAHRIAAVDEVLENLPPDAEITATTWFAVHLYQREKVYMFPNFFSEAKPTKYLVCRPDEADLNSDKLSEFIDKHGYVQVEEAAFVRVYVLG